MRTPSEEMCPTNFHFNNSHIQKTPVIDVQTEAHLHLRATFFNGREIVMDCTYFKTWIHGRVEANSFHSAFRDITVRCRSVLQNYARLVRVRDYGIVWVGGWKLRGWMFFITVNCTGKFSIRWKPLKKSYVTSRKCRKIYLLVDAMSIGLPKRSHKP